MIGSREYRQARERAVGLYAKAGIVLAEKFTDPRVGRFTKVGE